MLKKILGVESISLLQIMKGRKLLIFGALLFIAETTQQTVQLPCLNIIGLCAPETTSTVKDTTTTTATATTTTAVAAAAAATTTALPTTTSAMEAVQKRTIVRLRMKTGADLTDPNIRDQVLQQLESSLKNQVSSAVKLQWRHVKCGKQQKEDICEEERDYP